jgi:hypothetical protein
LRNRPADGAGTSPKTRIESAGPDQAIQIDYRWFVLALFGLVVALVLVVALALVRCCA